MTFKLELLVLFPLSNVKSLDHSLLLFFLLQFAILVTTLNYYTTLGNVTSTTTIMTPIAANNSSAIKLPANITIAPGVEMPMLGLGTYKITGADSVRQSFDDALSIGYRFFDTAQFYNNEQDIGAALKVLLSKYNLKRSDIFVTTKLMEMIPGKTVASLQNSLDKLQLDYVDLFLIHYPKPKRSMDDKDPQNKPTRIAIWKEMENVLALGKTKSIGVSNYEPRHMDEIFDGISSGRFTVKPSVNQCELHPHFQRSTLLSYCKQKGVHFQAFSSLARFNPDLHQSEPIITDLARKYNATTSQICLAWAMKRKHVSVIPKSTNKERQKSNFESVVVADKISDDDLAKIDSLDKNKTYLSLKPWDVA